MFCQKCGKKLVDEQVCDCMQNQKDEKSALGVRVQPNVQQEQPLQYYIPAPKNPKVSCAKSAYIFIFWLCGFSKELKNDPLVRFHVGQGMMLSIVTAGLLMLKNIVFAAINYISILSKLGGPLYNSSYADIPASALIAMMIMDIAVLVFYVIFMLIGISNASKKLLKPLPIFGKSAFYK